MSATHPVRIGGIPSLIHLITRLLLDSGMAMENATTFLISFVALGIVVWGYVRSRKYGQFGLLAWLQSLVLMAPWLLFFGLFAFGIYVDFTATLFLFLISTGVYIYLGRRLRMLGEDPITRDRIAQMMKAAEQEAKTQEAKAQNGQVTEGSTGSPEAAAKPGMELPPLFHPIPPTDLELIKGIFGVDTFFAVETIPYQQGAIFKGNLRGEPQPVQQHLSDLLDQRLPDRYRLFLVESPEEKPVIIVLPRDNDPKPLSPVAKVLTVVLAIATILTCFERGGIQYGFDLFANPNQLPVTLPIGLGVLSILLSHELGHWWMARRHQVRLSWPFFIPAWQLGSFGAITRFESLLPNRSVLFDIAFVGPAVGGILSIGCLILGLLLPPGESGIALPTPFFQGSILVGTLARATLGQGIHEPIVVLHPLFVAGWLGLVITALNIIPAGQLDGGRIVQAIYGRKTAGRITIVALVVLAILSFANPVALYWTILVAFLQRQPERPSLEELTEPNDTRAALALLMLFLMLATLLPLTPSLAGRLGIESAPEFLQQLQLGQ
jgi:membrane-associated protease RseP (regulator of RpoE activity)